MGYYLVGAALSAAAFGIGIWVGRRRRPVAYLVACLTLGLLVFKAVLHYRPALEARFFPWPDYIYFQSYWFYPLALFYLGVAVPMLRRQRLRRALRAFAAFVFAASLLTESWMILPPDDSSTQQADRDHHCVQTLDHSCAPAACVSLLSHWEIEATEGEMSRLCHLRSQGTTLFNIYRGLSLKLHDTDLQARIIEPSVDELRRRGVPAIVVIGDGLERHAVTVAFRDGMIVLNDPAQPEAAVWTVDQLGDAYRGTAVILEASP